VKDRPLDPTPVASPSAAPAPAEPVREEIVPGPPVGATPELTVTVPEQEPVQSRLLVVLWLLVVGAGLAALVAAMVPVGPTWLDGAGAVAVVTAYSWALAARTGGRPVVFGALALALGGAVLALDQDYLRTGAAVMTCVVSAVLGVMATTPAVQFTRAARECVIAVLVASAPTAATRTATTHSRAARKNRTAGVVAMTPSTAETTQVITAAPVRR